MILFGGFLLLVSHLFGVSKILMCSLGILSNSSLLAGVSESETVSNAGRVLQILGSAVITLVAYFSPTQIGKLYYTTPQKKPAIN